MGEEKQKLYIRTLGGLEIFYNGEHLDMGLACGGKIMQLFLILVWSGEGGLSRGKLQDYLYDRETTNVANALRISATRLRKAIADSPLPAGDYVRSTNGIYRLGADDIECQMDVSRIEREYQELQGLEEPEERLRLLLDICKSYKGEFLPGIPGDFWIEIIRSAVEKIYVASVSEACAILLKKGQYERVNELCTTAMRACPSQEWTEIFENVRELAAAKQPEFLDEILRRGSSGSAEGMPRETGAMPCSTADFAALYHRLSMQVRKKNFHAMLLTCTLSGFETFGKNQEKAAVQAQGALCIVLEKFLRRGDYYTLSGIDRVLVLAGGLQELHYPDVRERICDQFSRKAKKGVTLEISGEALQGK